MVKILSLIIIVIILTVVILVSWALVSNMVGGMFEIPQLDPEHAAEAGLFLLTASFLNTLVLVFIITRSRWHGIKLILTIFLLLFGVQTFMSQIETVFYGHAFDMGTKQVIGLFVIGFINALIVAPLMVLVLGKFREDNGQKDMVIVQLANSGQGLRILIIILLYLFLYYTFGYYIAWQNPDLRYFYTGSTEITAFLPHMKDVLTNDMLAILFQAFRGILWVLLALPVIYMMRGRKWEMALAIGLLFGVLFSTQLLLPNPYMPDNVRIAHFIETVTSTFVFGLTLPYIIKIKRTDYSQTD